MLAYTKSILFLFISLFIVACQASTTKGESSSMATSNPQVTIKTSLGDFTLELYPDKAPKTVENFLSYVDAKFYNDTIFHRVIDGFMIQGGGLNANMENKKTSDSIVNEAQNGLKNERGTIAMARTSDINSATSQFFINVSDNTFLNFQNATASGYGYCVFGKVIKGMDVVDKIKNVKTTTRKGHQNVPIDNVVIKEVIKLQ